MRLPAAIAGVAFFSVGAIAQTSLTTPVHTISEPVGTKSSAQSVTVTITTAGTLSAINLLTEGINNKDFQLTTYSCSPNAALSVNQTCSIGYTFQPQAVGERRGGVTLNDANGNPLGTAYLSGYGTGPQIATYAGAAGFATPQLVVSNGSITGQIATDGANNLYYATTTGSGVQIYKATPNSDGTYSSSVIGNGPALSYDCLGLAVDGLGNVFYALETDQGRSLQFFIEELVPNSAGYSQKTALTPSGNSEPNQLAVDGDGTIYFYDGAEVSLVRAEQHAGSYALSTIGSQNPINDIAVDAEHNLYLAVSDGHGYGSKTDVYLYDPSQDAYTSILTPAPYTYPGTYQYGITPDASGSFWLSDGGNGSTSVYRFIPVTGGSTYSETRFSQPISAITGSIRFDSLGNMFFRDITNGNAVAQGIYKISATPSLSYPATTSGGTSAAQDVILTNLGNASLTSYNNGFHFPGFVSQVSGNGENGYSDCSSSFSLGASGTCDLNTVFTPASNANGLLNSYILAYSNSDNDAINDVAIPVQGTAVHPLPTVASISPSSGDMVGGTSVTITGTYLGDATAVSFNSTQATSFSLVNATQLMAIAPAGTANAYATITVTNPGGSGQSTTNAWHWNPLPTNTSTVTLGTGSIPQNGTTTVTATVSANGSALANAVVTFISSNGSVAAAPTQAVTNSSGVATATIQGLYPGTTTVTATVDGVTLSNSPVLIVTPAIVAVGTTLSGQTVNVVIEKAGTLSSILSLNKGKNSADWGLSAYSCSPGAGLTANQICTITYSFTPVAAGLRQGAVVLEDGSGNVLGETFLLGIGYGAQGVFTNGVVSAQAIGTSDSIASVAVDDSGNMYFSDQTTETVSKLASGSATPTVLASSINTVTGVAVDGAGNVFYGAYGGNEVYELVNGAGTPEPIASVTNPDIGMATDGAGNIYVSSPQQVIKIDAITHATTKVGTASGYVPGVAVDSTGNIYYTDTSNNVIYRTPAGSTTGTAIVSSGLNAPRGITVDPAGDLYVVSQNGGTLTRLTVGTWVATSVASGHPFNSIVLDQYGDLFSAMGSSGLADITRTGGPTISFPSTPALSTSATSQVEFENDGSAAMTVSSYSAPNNFSLESVTNGCAVGSLAVAATCQIGVAFTPQSASSLLIGFVTLDESSGAVHSFEVSGTATKINQTITFPQPSTPATNGTQVTLAATASSGLTVTYSVSGPATINGAVVSYTGIGTVLITASAASNNTYNAAPQVMQSVTVENSQTITFPQLATSALSGSQVTLAATSSSGLAVTYTVTGPATLSGSTLSYTGAGTVVVTASQAGNATYAAATAVQQTINVQTPQTITFPALITPVLSGTQAALGATSSSGLAVTYTVSGPATLSGSTLSYTGAGTVIVTATQAGNTIYAAATAVPQTVYVQTAQTIAFPALATPVLTGTQVTLGATASSGLAVTYSVSGPAMLSGSTLSYGGAGTVIITASQTGNASYVAATPVQQTISVQNPQTITFPTLATPVLTGTQVTLGATASSGLAVTYTVSGPATLNGSTLNYSSSGTVVIIASQVGNATYAAATAVQQTVTVLASQTITFANPGTQTYGAVQPVSATSSSGLAVTFSSSTRGICTVTSGGALTYVAAGTCTIIASQGGNATYTAAATVPQSFTMQPASQTIIFSPAYSTETVGTNRAELAISSNHTFTVTLTSSTTSVCTVSGITVNFIAIGTCTLTASQAGNADYAAATPVTKSVTVIALPGAPTIGVASTGGSSATVNFTAPASNGNSAIATYTVTSSPGNIMSTGVASPITVTGLTNGTAYTFTVTATNAAGTGPASAASNSVIPEAIPYIFVAGTSSVASLDLNGNLTSSAVAGGGTGAAVDASGYIWSINSNGTSVSTFTSAGALGTSYSPTGVAAANALAMDGGSNVIIANGNGTILTVSNGGASLSTTKGSTTAAPSSIAVDLSGNVWVANPSTSTIDEIIGGAAPVAPLATAVQNNSPGVRP